MERAQIINNTLQKIVGNVQHISGLNAQIATATEEQSIVINDINIHVLNINESTEQYSQITNNIESSSNKTR